jgi:hypoxanthine phosphoribosyltransferase
MKKGVESTWESMDLYCDRLAQDVIASGFKPDCIIGLLRGGVIPARLLADRLDIISDFDTIDIKFYTGIGETLDKPVVRPHCVNPKGKKILIVDDIWDTGKTMRAALEEFAGEDMRTLTFCYKRMAEGSPDFMEHIVEEDEWFVFPWEKKEYARMREEEAAKEALGNIFE